jgi:3D (Asp-Asp-Asp) domain-containing protein
MSYQNWILSKINKKIIEKSVLILIIFVLVWQFALPRFTSLAYTVKDQFLKTEQVQAEKPKSPVDELGEPTKVMTVPVTAYNSLPGQTDSTPCITANGFNLCKNNQQNVIAANFLPFGTKVRFPDYDPNTIYTVQDRMNARYYYRADIWMKNRPDAVKFGLQNLKIEIYQ